MLTHAPFQKVMAANRGEIAVRIMRAATELGCRTVGIYSAEDRNTAHPSKADEAYLIGIGKAPVAAYLDIDDIVATAVKNNVQAVHPGYGFLSENPAFNQKLEEAGIRFVGPTVQNLIEFGDKTKARQLAAAANVPLVPGTEEAVTNVSEAKQFTDVYGFPIIIKAAHGGGGKGMRVVMKEEELEPMMSAAMGEALSSFGNGTSKFAFIFYFLFIYIICTWYVFISCALYVQICIYFLFFIYLYYVYLVCVYFLCLTFHFCFLLKVTSFLSDMC